MTAVKYNHTFKKLGALVMAMCLTFALAVGASAKSGTNVTFYKNNGTSLSMADDAIAGNAVVTTLEDGRVKIDIPVRPIYNYTAMGMFTADGYLQDVKVKGAESSVTPNETPYDKAVLTIVAPSMPADGRFVVTSSRINLYEVGTNNGYWMSHVAPSFIIEVTA